MAAADRAPHALAVVHQLPGRLRIELPADARTDGLPAAVTALPGVIAASWSPTTRRLLVRYDPDAIEAAAVLDAVAAHAGATVPEAVDAAPAAASADGRPTLATTVTALFGDVNERVSRLTGGALTLGALVPAALTLWAAREIIRGRTAPLVWSSALWYAHGLFRDYNVPTRDA